MKMIGTILYIFIAWLRYVSVATATQTQEISLSGTVVSVDFSMLSASCANETLHLINNTYTLVQTSYICSAKNDTVGVCSLDVYPDEYESKCTIAGGQFYMNQTSEEFYKCFSYIDGVSSSLDFGISNYPICAGASCNFSEVKTAFYETLSADVYSGPISDSLSDACDLSGQLASTPVPTSTQTQEILLRDRYVAVDYSMLSTSCANETLHLVSEMYALVLTLITCEANETGGVCFMEVYPDEYETKCTDAGGQFYTNLTSMVLYSCLYNDIVTDVGLARYPICAGASCNAAEVETAYNETLSADADNGPINDRLSDACDRAADLIKSSLKESTSSAYTRFNSIIHAITFTIVVIPIFMHAQ